MNGENETISSDDKINKKKSFVKFGVIMMIAMIIGGVIGGILNWIGASFEVTLQIIGMTIMKTSPFVLIVLGVTAIGGGLVCFWKAKVLKKNWDGEDEGTYEKIDRACTIANGFAGVGTVFNMLWFGITMEYQNTVMNYGMWGICVIAAFLIICFGELFLQRSVIDFMKKINPEKQGDVLDMNFQKKWMASCDEQEKQVVYKAAYKVYSTSCITYAAISLVLLLGSCFYGIGVLPYFVLGVIWISQTIIYIRESARLTAHPEA